tara:strand:- start:84 stop:230 length:147 start_codon:yes stop_codon:yes gene_type:complete
MSFQQKRIGSLLLLLVIIFGAGGRRSENNGLYFIFSNEIESARKAIKG